MDNIPATPAKIGSLDASQRVVRESWAILKQDREIIWFPIISLLCSMIALTALVIIYWFVRGGDLNVFDQANQRGAGAIWNYGFAFIYYLVSFFIVNFFQAGILIIANARFNNQNFTFEQGFQGAAQNIRKIFLWSLISATVGVILDILYDKFKLVGKIAATVLGAAWNIMTYFSLPSLIIGQTSVKDSFKESARVIRKTWGEAIIINFGAGLFFSMIIILGAIISGILIAAFPTPFVFISVSTIFVVFILSIIVLSSALGIIFKLALYKYALTGQIPPGFSPELIQGAVKVKS